MKYNNQEIYYTVDLSHAVPKRMVKAFTYNSSGVRKGFFIDQVGDPKADFVRISNNAGSKDFTIYPVVDFDINDYPLLIPENGSSVWNYLTAFGIDVPYSSTSETITLPPIMMNMLGDITLKTAGMFSDRKMAQVQPSFDLPRVVSINRMFEGCQRLKKGPGVLAPLCKDAEGMFLNCSEMEASSTLNLPIAENTSYMFSDCQNLKSVGCIIAPKVKDMSLMFKNCKSLSSLLWVIDFGSCVTADRMFLGCTSITPANPIQFKNVPAKLDLSNIGIAPDCYKILNTI